mmetsp:Transcript_102428/g.289343  ORF Transcript_102428/g.289343 Transcript_102428/m.289343 type:complete len:214 (-) Transcript_102428:525-1166(-)
MLRRTACGHWFQGRPMSSWRRWRPRFHRRALSRRLRALETSPSPGRRGAPPISRATIRGLTTRKPAHGSGTPPTPQGARPRDGSVLSTAARTTAPHRHRVERLRASWRLWRRLGRQRRPHCRWASKAQAITVPATTWLRRPWRSPANGRRTSQPPTSRRWPRLLPASSWTLCAQGWRPRRRRGFVLTWSIQRRQPHMRFGGRRSRRSLPAPQV